MIPGKKYTMLERSTAGLLVTMATMVGAGCHGSDSARDAAQPAFQAEVTVTSDPGHGIGGAELLASGTSLAKTDGEGRATVSFHGTEGDSVDIAVKCPAGFESPSQPITVSLRRLSEGSRAPSFNARCAPLTRTVVVGIRVENGPNLPVTYLGKEVGHTDAWGAAHVVLSVKAGEQVTLGIDTKSGADKRPRLRPENPTLTFVAKDKDDFVTLDQKFEVERTVVRAKVVARAPGPTKI